MSPPEDAHHRNTAHALFDGFLLAKSCEETLQAFQDVSQCLGLTPEPDGQLKFYQKLKSHLNYWKAKALWAKLDKKAGHDVYNQGRDCANTRCLVVGAGPCGLRTAIELAFLGAKVIVVEQRESFSRNNVLHLWPFSILDLRALGAKKYHGRFCTGTLDHVSIRQLQLILLKTTLLLGVEVFVGFKFKDVLPPATGKQNLGKGWRAAFQPSTSYLCNFQFDVLISAGGSKLIPDGFRRKELRGKLAIGITANFINRHTSAEVKVAEISGVARIYNQKFFQNLLKQTGIDLENIVYYKDDTHYFVMTAKKQSLLKMGVIVQDVPDTEDLLSRENVDYDALYKYAQDAASFSTGYQLPQMEFALNHQGRPDVDMFDFTCMYRAENAALVRERHGSRLLMALVGDCLVEPFWPLGTGVARGFLAAYDAAWMVKRWASGTPPLDVLAERESIYQHLSQTTPDNTNKSISQYSLDPASRYPNLNLRAIKPNQVRHLYDAAYTERDHNKAEGKARRPVLSHKDSISVYDELLTWCRKHTVGYRAVAVVDLTHSWRSGLALCALIHRFRPHLIDFDSLDQNAAAHNNQLAFDLAEQELGILPIMTGTEMACVSEPDRLSLVTYLSQFYEAFKDEPLLPSPPPGPGAGGVKITSFSGAKSAILFLNKLQKTLSLKRNAKGVEDLESEAKRKKSGSCESPEDLSPCWSSESIISPGNQSLSRGSMGTVSARNQSLSSGSEGTLDSGRFTAYSALVVDGDQGDHCSSTASPERLPSSETRQTLRGQTLTGCSDACYFCDQRVYIVERVSAEGLFFHRSCFRCHQCDATLRLGNYAFDEDDGYFYCMIHYSTRLDDYFQPFQPNLSVQETSGLDGQSLSPTADQVQRMESASAFTPALQPLDFKELDPLASIISDNVSHPPVISPGPPCVVSPTARTQLPDSLVSPGSETISRAPLEAFVGALDGGETNGGIHRNGRSWREVSWDTEEYVSKQSDSKATRPAVQCSRDQSAPPETNVSQPEDEAKRSKMSKRRIQLTEMEKMELSSLSLDSGAETQTDLRGLESRFLMTGLDEADSCESEEGSTEEEEEEEEEIKTVHSPVKEEHAAKRGESWKMRTLQRRAKEEEKKRFCKAQSIQRRLEEIEEQYRELEQLGIKLEKSLRDGPEFQGKSELIGQWLLLVQDKNGLVSEESDLMIEAQALELEEQQSSLEWQLRHYIDLDDVLKSPQDRAEEARTLNRMLEVVDKRNALITFLDEKRLNEVTQQLHVMH